MPSKLRRPGGGRPALTQTAPTLLEDLRGLLESTTLGDPMRPLLWVSKSHAKLALALRGMGHRVSASRIPQLLGRLGYRRQVNRKTLEGGPQLDRNAQFEHINAQVEAFQAAGQPVILVDTDEELGKVAPYGVYDIGENVGWVSVGIDHDTSEFAVNSIRRWRELMGRERYPESDRLMITADGGGTNGSRVRLWKVELQKFVDETGLTAKVCHYPPGTSKWNKIEHRLFCDITQNWRGRPLTSRSAVVELIAATTTKKGLTVHCELDANAYQKGIKVSDAEMAALNIEGDAFHPEWNYTVRPRRRETPS